MDWPYYTLRKGKLFDENNKQAFTKPNYSTPAAPVFETVWQAEDWLQTYDLRGNVREEA